MQAFLVGGAVRDRLLALPVTDRDWVVVGSTAEAMDAAGYKRVGRDFPVFLHPDTHEEYALARTERKTAPGYRGFEIHAAPDVTLEQDLMRRDLTINAIAESTDGTLIDPYGGVADLDNRILRHVSPAFAEDPVRILRVARFAARFANFGFKIAPETLDMMRSMVVAGETDALVAERVWGELTGALLSNSPQVFFSVLRDIGALHSVLPEIDELFDVPQTATYHQEGDVGIHTLMVVEQAAALAKAAYPDDGTQTGENRQSRIAIVFASLCHDLGKALTRGQPNHSHHGHEKVGVEPVKALCKRLHVPNDCRDLAVVGCRYHLHCHRALELKASTLVKTLSSLDVMRKPERLQQFLLLCEADAMGRIPAATAYPQAQRMQLAAQAMRGVDAGSIAAQQTDRSKIPDAIYQAQVSAVKQAIKNHA